MKVKQIKVNAGRTFNHPYESFSNMKSDVEYVAELEDGEDVEAATKQLRHMAEQSAENHKQLVLKTLENIEETARIEANIERANVDAETGKIQKCKQQQ